MIWICLLFVWNWVFWNLEMGLNLVVFSLLTVAATWWANRQTFQKSTVFFAFLGCYLVCSFSFLYLHSEFSGFLCLLTWVALVGHLQQTVIRSYYLGALQYARAFFYFPIRKINFGNTNFNQRYLRILNGVQKWFVPMLLLGVFWVLFLIASVPFQNFVIVLLEKFVRSLFKMLAWLNLPWFIFMGVGLLVIKGFLYQGERSRLVKWEMNLADKLVRFRAKPKRFTRFSPIELRKSHDLFFKSFVVLNLLLLVVNVLDIQHIWFGDQVASNHHLSAQVHKGVGTLIFSVLLAGAIVGYVFRGNLNFLRGNEKLKNLALLWIGQNTLLLFSVGLRNQFYIQQLGLTYKRIGVYVFLLIVLIGLVFLVLKVAKTKSFFYLARMNSFSVMIVLSLCTLISWDHIILNHNLKNHPTKTIDYYYLLSLSMHVQPQLKHHLQNPKLHLPEEKRAVYLQIASYNLYHFQNLPAPKFWEYNLADAGLRERLGEEK